MYQSQAEAVKVLVVNIKLYIAFCKRHGTVGMSKANLKQVISTQGINLPGAASFDSAFAEAVNKVKVRGFEIYEGQF